MWTADLHDLQGMPTAVQWWHTMQMVQVRRLCMVDLLTAVRACHFAAIRAIPCTELSGQMKYKVSRQ